jgi:hypothetical protein
LKDQDKAAEIIAYFDEIPSTTGPFHKTADDINAPLPIMPPYDIFNYQKVIEYTDRVINT